MDEFTEVNFRVRVGIDADPDGGDGDPRWQRLHWSTAQVREDHGCGRPVFEHVLSDRGEVGAPTTDDDDFIEFVFLVEVIFPLDAVIEKHKRETMGVKRLFYVLNLRIKSDDFTVRNRAGNIQIINQVFQTAFILLEAGQVHIPVTAVGPCPRIVLPGEGLEKLLKQLILWQLGLKEPLEHGLDLVRQAGFPGS